ncbi:helix-turn-helix domain-containing protein [Paracoccus aestuariivivens]|uniref:Helix-turn-helix domain-containing protein n=1 Tax=Paracoccus aestuariivivens TaxID=1820333 RepID=A0A6L6JEW1_9RHOB|nr:helix-turn-helix transcriptional regulator [Paracoccus aestuariivivens]MTH79279.1 helix-turn-helix domain-containing protein [Paracoccus aestuariivivens]
MTQRDLADKLGCYPAKVGYIVRGQRRLDVIEMFSLAQAIGVSPARFFTAEMAGMQPEERIENFSEPLSSRSRKRTEE